MSTMPEWRQRHAITESAVLAHKHLWVLRDPRNDDLVFVRAEPAFIGGGIDWILGDDEDVSYYTLCRPVDREGLPVPWAEVGL